MKISDQTLDKLSKLSESMNASLKLVDSYNWSHDNHFKLIYSSLNDLLKALIDESKNDYGCTDCKCKQPSDSKASK